MCKKILCAMLALTLCLAASGCNQTAKRTDEEILTAFLTAYQSGDAEAAKKYIGDDSPMQDFLGGLNDPDMLQMDELYQAVYKSTKDFTYTITQTQESGVDMMLVTINSKDCVPSIQQAMVQAMETQITTGEPTFDDMTTWLLSGVENATATSEKEVKIISFGSVYGPEVMDGNSGRELFSAMTGGFFDYIDTTLTLCQGTGDGMTIDTTLVAAGDEILATYSREAYDTTNLDATQLQAAGQNFMDTLNPVDGITAYASQTGDTEYSLCYGVDFEQASIVALKNLGVVPQDTPINSSLRYLSLNQTIAGYEASGMTCVTTPDFSRLETARQERSGKK